jgi:hypothetical protein
MVIGVEWKRRVAASGTEGRTDAKVREANLADSARRDETDIVEDITKRIAGYVNDVV